jgi:hypothetical protein
MENALPLLIITPNRLFADTIARHLTPPCKQTEDLSEPASALLLLPETLLEVMQMDEQASQLALPCLMLLPEEASRAQPQFCRNVQRPIALAELQQEIHLLLQQPRKLHWQDVGSFDPAGLRLSNLFGQSTSLTEKEAALITYLSNQPKAVSRDTLLKRVWHYHPDTDTHTLETHLYRLRQKLHELFGDKLQIVSDDSGYRLIAG